jgi:hypothetical protein
MISGNNPNWFTSKGHLAQRRKAAKDFEQGYVLCALASLREINLKTAVTRARETMSLPTSRGRET